MCSCSHNAHGPIVSMQSSPPTSPTPLPVQPSQPACGQHSWFNIDPAVLPLERLKELRPPVSITAEPTPVSSASMWVLCSSPTFYTGSLTVDTPHMWASTILPEKAGGCPFLYTPVENVGWEVKAKCTPGSIQGVNRLVLYNGEAPDDHDSFLPGNDSPLCH